VHPEEGQNRRQLEGKARVDLVKSEPRAGGKQMSLVGKGSRLRVGGQAVIGQDRVRPHSMVDEAKSEGSATVTHQAFGKKF
jgi:hypothetical protein